ncbi:hypothetical protein [Paenarthrobacter sp. NPDC089316]|uniref:hypothetical protein n=1 Tax=unclassified Paenarthrobacter TaxID=2634190 RepID=UPI0034411B32
MGILSRDAGVSLEAATLQASWRQPDLRGDRDPEVLGVTREFSIETAGHVKMK